MINNALKKDLEYTFSKLSDKEKGKLFNSTILITGAAGFLGFYYVHFLYYYLYLNKRKPLPQLT